jgi:predicted metal-dependent phosphoesterase TrpH
MKWIGLVGLLVGSRALAQPGPGDESDRWLRANFHAHSARDLVDDDGSETPEALHRALRAAGFDFSVHTPHSTVNVDTDAPARFAAQRAAERKLDVPGLEIVVGEELTVADGPHYQRRTRMWGHEAPGNLNHLSVFGMRALVPSKTTLAEACDRVHRDGGVCIVNHPGPGPMMWEDGLWEAPENRDRIDGIEVYNGQAFSAVGIDFEARYREATAYSGLGLKIAAVTGADTHGPRSVARARAQLAGFGLPPKLLRLMLPATASARPELEAATLVRAESHLEGAVVDALRARRTVAVYGLPHLAVACPGLGEVRHTRAVALSLSLSRRMAEVTLYREGVPVRTWHNVREVSWSETVRAPTAYVFGARDGAARLTTSAIWFEPPTE